VVIVQLLLTHFFYYYNSYNIMMMEKISSPTREGDGHKTNTLLEALHYSAPYNRYNTNTISGKARSSGR
jgi:hypothetical protein